MKIRVVILFLLAVCLAVAQVPTVPNEGFPAFRQDMNASLQQAVNVSTNYTNPNFIGSLAWAKITGVPTFLLPSNNLSDLTSPATARGNLGLGGAATLPIVTVLGNPGSNGNIPTEAAVRAAFPIQTVFGRSGTVIAQTGDYSASQITNAVDATGSYSNPSFITSLAYSKITGVPSFEPALGNPSVSGYVLASTTTGTRSWVPLNLGTVTSVGIAGTSNQITVSGCSTITTSGTCTLSLPSGLVFPGRVIFAAGTTSNSSFNIASGSAPNSPSAGDVWNLNGIFQYHDGVGVRSLLTDASNLAWAKITGAPTFLTPGNNLSDVSNAVTARTNLGLGTAATQATSAFEVPLTFSGFLNRISNNVTLPVWGTGSRPVTANALGVSGNCVSWGASGLTDTGSPCGTGSGTGANALGFYLVNQAANAPANAINLALLGNGILKQAVSGGIATPSIAAAGTDYEAPLGNPSSNGQVLSSNTSGVRSWVNAGVGTVTSLTFNGTSNQITVSGCTTITSSGTCTLSLPNNLILPGKLGLFAGSTSTPSMNIASGVAPTSPASGDFWNLGGILQYHDGTATRSLLTDNSSLAWGKLTGVPTFLTPANNLSDVASAATARTNLSLTATATAPLVTTLGNPGSNSNVPTEAAVRAAIGAGGAVSSVFTRSGAVTAQTGDYTAAQVTNAVDSTGSYSNPAWITALAYSKITGVPTFLTPANNLSDLANVATARTNLGLGTAATQASSAFEVPLTFSGFLTRTSNTVTLPVFGAGSRPVTANALGTSGNCVAWGASGLTDTGSPCGSGGGSGANALGSYWVSGSANAPANAVNLGLLTAGLVKISVSAGVATPSTAVAGTDYQAPITTGTVDQYFDGTLGLKNRAACVSAGGVLQYDSTAHGEVCHTLASADIPNNAANTTGTASNVTGIVTEAHGGTGLANTPGAAGHVLRSNGTHYVDSAIQSADIPNNAANTTGSAGSFTGSLAGDVTGTQGATNVGKINGVSMAGLATGILKNTTGTGAPSIATAGDFPTFNQNTTGNAATATALAAGPTVCPSGQAPQGILANGNATGCTAITGGGGASFPGCHAYTYTTGTLTVDFSTYTCAVVTASGANPTLAFTAPTSSAATPLTLALVNDTIPRTWTLPGTAKQIFTPSAANTGVWNTSIIYDGANFQGPGSNETPGILRFTSERSDPGTGACLGGGCLVAVTGDKLRYRSPADVVYGPVKTGGDVNIDTGVVNATTAVALAATPTPCSTGQAPTGVDASGNSVGCASISGGGGTTLVEAHLSTYGTCTSGTTNRLVAVDDSNSGSVGATVTGGGSVHVLAYCNSTNWIVSSATGLATGVTLNTPSLGTGSSPLTRSWVVGTGGVTANHLVQQDTTSGGALAIAATTDFMGIATSTKAGGATVEVSAIGAIDCTAGTGGVTENNYAILGSGGVCADSGQTDLGSITGGTHVIGRFRTTATAGSLARVDYTPGLYGQSGWGSGGSVGGSGTVNTVPIWTGTGTLGNSAIVDNGTTTGIGANFNVNETTGVPAKIAGITTAGNGVPVIGWVQPISNSSATSAVTLATAPGTGDYEIHYSLDLHSPCTTGGETLVLSFGWTANSGRTFNTGGWPIGSSQSTSSYYFGTIPIHVNSGNVTFTPSLVGGTACATGTATWDGKVWMTVN